MDINTKETDSISTDIENIIEEASDLDEMQSKLILLVQRYLKNKNNETSSISTGKMKFNDEKIALDIAKFTRDLIKKYEDIDPDIGTSGDDNNYSLSKKSKIALKKIIKEFAIYEIYKTMNPRRIAGETKKDNYAHNMVIGGDKRASKYEGGKASDLRAYGKSEVQRIERASKIFRGSGKGFDL